VEKFETCRFKILILRKVKKTEQWHTYSISIYRCSSVSSVTRLELNNTIHFPISIQYIQFKTPGLLPSNVDFIFLSWGLKFRNPTTQICVAFEKKELFKNLRKFLNPLQRFLKSRTSSQEDGGQN